jgi:inorganic pyrophosphatase
MNLVTDIDQNDDFPETVVGVSVAQMNSRKKYEYRQDVQGIILDRMLHSEVRYPGDYGFVPQTAMGDGDPLDVLVLLESSLFPGCILDVRPVGVLRMTDEGENDDKIVGVPADDPRFDHIGGVEDVPQHERDEIVEFFATYKNLEPGGDISVDGFDGAGAARQEIERANERFSFGE